MNISEREMWQIDFIFVHTHHFNWTEVTLWGLRNGCEPHWILEEIVETLALVIFVSTGLKAGGWKSSENLDQKWKFAKKTILKGLYCKTHVDFLRSDKTNIICTSLWMRAAPVSRTEGCLIVTDRRQHPVWSHQLTAVPPCFLRGLWDTPSLGCDILAKIQKGPCSILKGVDVSVVSDFTAFVSQRTLTGSDLRSRV